MKEDLSWNTFWLHDVTITWDTFTVRKYKTVLKLCLIFERVVNIIKRIPATKNNNIRHGRRISSCNHEAVSQRIAEIVTPVDYTERSFTHFGDWSPL